MTSRKLSAAAPLCSRPAASRDLRLAGAATGQGSAQA